MAPDAKRHPLHAFGDVHDRYLTAVCARPKRAGLLLFLACLPALALSIAFFGHIDASLQELLPPSAPSVRALKELHALVGGKAHLTVIARSPDRAANEAFIDALTKNLAALHAPEIRSIQGDVKQERSWLMKRGPLLMPRADFDKLISRFDAAAKEEKERNNPLKLDLGEEEAKPPPFDWKPIEDELDAAVGKQDRFPSGYLATPDGQTVVALIWLEGSEVDLEPSAKLLADTEAEVAKLHASFPNVQVAYNGEVPNMVEEHAAILADLSLSTIFVMALVGACIAIYFRSVRAVATVVLALAPGLLFTFALGRLTVGGLNSNTAFLGTIIAGNGINYPLLFLAYYRAQQSSLTTSGALASAARQALPGTLGAALTASAAYGGLAVSDFRGFSQFGWLGGSGMVLVWIFTYLSTPILVAIINPPRRITRTTLVQELLHAFFSKGPLSAAAAGLFVVVAFGASGLGIVAAMHTGVYEMDLQVLRNRDSLAHGSASWDAKMNELFGVWLNPVVALAKDPAEREPAATELRRVFAEKDPGGIQSVETIEKFVPPLPEQTSRLQQLKRLSSMVHRLPKGELPPKLQPYVDAWFAPDALQPITEREVPEPLIFAFRELSGRTDRVVLVYPSIKVNYNDGHNLQRFADVVQSAQLPPSAYMGGGFLFMAEILRLVHDQALNVVLVVTALVSVLLLAIFIRKPARAVVSLVTMVTAAFCSQAIMIALGTKVNLLNFAALPITIGVGADYVVNLFGAMTSLRADARAACAKMGGAILLCSLTTVIGYLSLVLAQSGALRSFGWAAVLGEAMAILMVLLVLPTLLGPRWAERPEPGGPAGEPEST
ncbi:MAG: MMPL family transporter [Deltaproteobacteria bacterium]|nr:MMPL family transporter [Deltaproteobacteria bacterium]